MELINVFDDLKNDMPIRDIIKKYRIGLPRLIKIIKKCNNTDIDFEEKIGKEIYDLKIQGYSYEKISKVYDASWTFIRDYIKKYCAAKKLDFNETKAVKQKIDLPMQEIYDMKKNGVSIDVIVRKYKVSSTTIYRRLKEYCDEKNLDVKEIMSSVRSSTLPMQEI